MEAVKPYELTVAEQLQIINLCPTTLVEVYLSVDDIETRMGAEKAAELLELIQTTLYVEEQEQHFPQQHATPSKMVLQERVSRPGDGKSQRGGKGHRGGRGGKFKSHRGGR